jgi:aspartyl-tRNA(Asn)/glutamyl-tRNA(Gln) amidotransferase subunit A
MTQLWLKMTACELGRGIDNKSISPIALVKTYLEAIRNHPLNNDIYARISSERALKEASAAEIRAKKNNRLSLLDGVPISWKDLFDSKGINTEAGSMLLSGRIPESDAVVLDNATQAGLVCLGKTHMSELAFSGLGLNPMTKTTPCVNNLDAVSGGSSSGAAGSVAFNLASIGIGSDTGGSVRVPAAWNDLVGLKTTSQDISLKGVVPLCPKFDTIGPLCRSVEDAAVIYSILKKQNFTPIKKPKSLRLMRLEGISEEGIENAPLTAFDNACAKISRTGIAITKHKFPILEKLLSLAGIIYTVEAYEVWGELLEKEGKKMYPEILSRFMVGKSFTQNEYKNAWSSINSIRSDWMNFTQEFDAVILPTSPILPPNKTKLLSDSPYYKSANLLALRNTRIGNMLGLCSITLPTSQPSCGFMIMGAPFSELKLLNIASKIEKNIT